MKQFLFSPKDMCIYAKEVPDHKQTDQEILQTAFWLQEKIEKEHLEIKESLK